MINYLYLVIQFLYLKLILKNIMSSQDKTPEISETEFKLEDLEEFVWRWKNHKKMLKIIYI